LNELVRSVRKQLCHSFLNYWNKKSKEPEGKLDTYFKIKIENEVHLQFDLKNIFHIFFEIVLHRVSYIDPFLFLVQLLLS
jgi:hypothetical protein